MFKQGSLFDAEPEVKEDVKQTPLCDFILSELKDMNEVRQKENKRLEKLLLLLNPDCKTSAEVTLKFSRDYQKHMPASGFKNDKIMYWKDVKNKGLNVIDAGHCFTTEAGECIDWHSEDAFEAQTWLLKVSKQPTQKEIILTMEALEVLKNCIVEGHVVKLPPQQLDRKDYEAVKKKLELIGGRWKGGKVQGFEFKEDPAELLEQIANGEDRNLKQEFQFFATPKPLAQKMVQLAGIEDGDCVLEPSAGQGNIIEAVYEMFPRYMKGPNEKPSVTVDYCEIMELNNNILTKKIHSSERWSSSTSCMAGDFLTYNPSKPYDKIIANPPFNKNQDIDHILKMFNCLKDGGRLVTIASPSWTFGSQKKQVEFRQWLEDNNAVVEELPPGTFKESGTNIKAMLIVIDKAA